MMENNDMMEKKKLKYENISSCCVEFLVMIMFSAYIQRHILRKVCKSKEKERINRILKIM
jgi:hypothetical protein